MLGGQKGGFVPPTPPPLRVRACVPTPVCTSVVQYKPRAPYVRTYWTRVTKRPVHVPVQAACWIFMTIVVCRCFNEMQQRSTVPECNVSLVGSNQARVTINNGAQASSWPRGVVITPLDTRPPAFSQRQHQAITTQGRPLSTIISKVLIKAVCKYGRGAKKDASCKIFTLCNVDIEQVSTCDQLKCIIRTQLTCWWCNTSSAAEGVVRSTRLVVNIH